MKRLLLLFIPVLAFTFALGLGMGDMALAATTNNDDPLELLGKTKIGGTTGAAAAGDQLPIIIGKLVKSALGLLGIILVVLMLYAGFMWMTAAGSEEKVTKAKQTITRAIIGAFIIFSAYAITGFVVNAIINASKAT